MSSKPVTDNQNASNNNGNKKRKLSDGATGPIKAPKTPRSEEKMHPKSKSKDVNDAENEVSSSSEPDNKHKNDSTNPKPKTMGLLDKFIQSAQQQEVSTSCNDDPIDLTDEDNKAAESRPLSDEEKTEKESVCEKEDEKEEETESMEVDDGSVEAEKDVDASPEALVPDKESLGADMKSPKPASGANKAKVSGCSGVTVQKMIFNIFVYKAVL